MIGAFKVTIELSSVDACRLCRILQSDRKEYISGMKSLEKIEEIDPGRILGPRKQTPKEAMQTTQKAIDTIERVFGPTLREGLKPKELGSFTGPFSFFTLLLMR